MVFPVTIGDGLRVFSAGRDRKVAWRLDDVQAFPTGVRVETWRPAAEAPVRVTPCSAAAGRRCTRPSPRTP